MLARLGRWLRVGMRWITPWVGRALIACGIAAAICWWSVRWMSAQTERMVDSAIHSILAGPEEEGFRAVSQLRALGEPGMRGLVIGASSSRPRVTPAARWAVEDIVSVWEGSAWSGEPDDALTRAMTKLAVVLGSQMPRMESEAKLWTRGVAIRLLELADAIPAGSRSPLVANCDWMIRQSDEIALLAKSAGTGSAELVDTTTILPPPPVAEDVVEAAEIPLPSDQETLGATEVEALQNSLSPDPDDTLYPPEVPPESQKLTRQDAFPQRPGVPEARLDWQEPSQLQTIEDRIPPTIRSIGDATQELLAELPKFSDRRVLAEWHAGTLPAEAAQQALAARGLEPIVPVMLEYLFSAEVGDRMQLLEQLQVTPGIPMSRWLRILAEDEDATVRLAVLRLMATSRDRNLVEHAWRIAISDEDPRVASLAPVLRARRAAF